MSLGVLPQIIATVTTVGPTIYGLVDAYQQRKKENAAAIAQATGGAVAPAADRPDWYWPVVYGVGASALAGGVLYWWYRKQKAKKGKRKSKRREREEVDDDDLDE